MVKLFSLEELPQDTEDELEALDIELPEENEVGALAMAHDRLEETSDALDVSIENLNILSDIQEKLSSYRVGSREYLVAIECYSPVIDRISVNLGVKRFTPAMEDYENLYSIKDSHQIAMEGIMDLLRKAWEVIRDLTKKFFNRLFYFLKVLSKSTLTSEEYVKRIPQIISRIKQKDLTYKGPKTIQTKLPQLLAEFGANAYDINEFMDDGIRKLDNLKSITNKVRKDLAPGLASNAKVNREKMVDIISSVIEGGQDVDHLIRKIEVVEEEASDMLDSILGFESVGLSDIPYDVINELNSKLERATKGVEYKSLAGNTKLPKSFDVYLATDPTGGIVITEFGSYTNKAIQTMDAHISVNTLEEIFDRFKDIKKESFMNDLIKVSDRVNKELDIISKTAMDNIPGAMDVVRSKMTVSMPIRTFSSSTLESLPRNEQGEYVLQYLNTMRASVLQIRSSEGKRGISNLLTNLHSNDSINNLRLVRDSIDYVLLDTDTAPTYGQGFRNNEDMNMYEDFTMLLERELTNLGASAPMEGYTMEEGERLIESLKGLDKYLKTLVNSYRNLIKGLIIELNKLQQECDVEVMRYINNCLQEFR